MAIHKRALTKRESEIFRLITAGKTNSEIADRLEVSVKTVEAHKHNILIKVGVDSGKDLKRFKLKKRG
jgi:DNA-binding NarL/FixJ family response regulator